MMHSWFNYGAPYGHGFMGFGPFGMIIFWGLIIAAVVVVVRNISGHAPCRSARETPGEILHRRYAAGEISAREYEEMKEKIKE